MSTKPTERSTNDQLRAGNVSAGLPNITGTHPYGIDAEAYDLDGDVGNPSGAFSKGSRWTSPTSESWLGATLVPDWYKLEFSAQNSNSIYGASTTVRPPSIPVTMWKRLDD